MKYLVIECEALNDQYECDANRTPVCMTDNVSNYGYGYEIWEVKEDGSLILYKDYETSLEEGMMLCKWEYGHNPEIEKPTTIINRYPKQKRSEISKPFCEELKQKTGFEETIEVIYHDIKSFGEYGEDIDGAWVVFGEYTDTKYPLGY